MEAKVIRHFFPGLVSAVGDCVQNLSDHCFAKRLISETTHTTVLKSGDTNNDKARTLLLALKKSSERDISCLKVFLNILEEVLPQGSDDPLLIAMRKYYADEADSNTVSELQTSSPGPQIAQPIQNSLDSATDSEHPPVTGHYQQVLPNDQLQDNISSSEPYSQVQVLTFADTIAVTQGVTLPQPLNTNMEGDL